MSDTNRIERTIEIEAPIDHVWSVLTEAGHLGRWFGDAGATIDLRAGGALTLTWAEHGTHLGVLDVVEAPTRLVFRWARSTDTAPAPGDETTVSFTLTEHDGVTKLHLLEAGFDTLPDPKAAHRANESGWDAELAELVTYVKLW